MSDGFYRAFEERYRGSRELIKGRLAHEKFVVHRLSMAGSYWVGASPMGTPRVRPMWRSRIPTAFSAVNVWMPARSAPLSRIDP